MMSRYSLCLMPFALLAVTGSATGGPEQRSMAEPAEPLAMTRPAEVTWGPAPAKLPPGAQMAVLAGDPAEPGALFTIRARLPDGYSVPPHTHPTDEHLTVIQGTMLLGMGSTFDATKLRELQAGSYARLSTKQPHFNLYKGETIIQLHGIGPYDVIYVNPADDPRSKGEAK
jgi:quercetin dioxygenase-like cupin family protein